MAMVTENAKRFSQNNLHKLEQLDSQQKDFRKRIIDTQTFVAEQPALNVTSREAFEDFWKKVHGSKTVFDQKHEQGAGRLSRGATSLAASANEILRDVSPILELVRDFGAPYGGMAIGTICFVFAVAGNRQKMEDQIITTFASIRDRLPGIRMYQHIYTDDHELDKNLQSKILDAYDSFLAFCMAAFDFYTRGSLRRWTKTLQYTTDLDEQALRVQKALVDVRLVCEDLLSKNVDTVKTSVNHLRVINAGLENEVERLTKEVQGLRLQLSELQANNDREYAEKIARLLGLWPFSDDTKHQDVTKHRGDVGAIFSPKNLRSRTTVAERQSAIVGSVDYQEWLNSSDSGLLVLSGVNEYARTHHCWVSPIALNLIDKLTADNDELEGGRDPCAFYLLGLRHEDDTWADVLSFLVYRLLELNKKALRDEKRCQELWSDLHSYSQVRELGQTVDHRSHKILVKLEGIALKAIELFGPGKTVWIVLDRVDKCKPIPESTARPNRKGGRSLLEAIVYLVERASVTVKVLAVVNSADWKVEEVERELGSKREASLVIKTCKEAGDRVW